MPPAPPILEYDSTPLPPRWARWLIRPIGWPLYTASILLALWILWAARLPDNLDVFLIIVFLGGPLAVLYFLRLILSLLLRRIYKNALPPPDRSRNVRRFTLILIVPFVTAMLLILGIPFRLALTISAPALEREALDILADPTSFLGGYPPTPIYFGLFLVRAITYSPDLHVVEFEFDQFTFLLDRFGVAYSPHDLPRSHPEQSLEYRPLYGPWYRFRTY
ncbi:MAG: hypothetical protein FWD53_11625 [Phycisphaerales bacterium]|nr:hypothetical protein [Phycisphaerales bacterium]